MSEAGRPDGRSRPRGGGATRVGRALAALALVLLGGSLAPARAADAPAPSGRRALLEIGLPSPVPSALDSVPHPWPGRALLLSAAGTALPFVLLAGGDGDDADARLAAGLALEVFAPAAGHLYGGLPRRALIGIGVRAAGFGLAAHALSSDSGEFDWNVVLALGGVAVVGLSALVDVLTVSGDVDRANRERLTTRVSLGMRATPTGRAPAVAMDVRF